MTKDEAIHKALKVLNCLNNDRVYEIAWVKGAINACEEALEQPNRFEGYTTIEIGHKKPAPSWQGLSDDEIEDLCQKYWDSAKGYSIADIIDMAEQVLKEKNNV